MIIISPHVHFPLLVSSAGPDLHATCLFSQGVSPGLLLRYILPPDFADHECGSQGRHSLFQLDTEFHIKKSFF